MATDPVARITDFASYVSSPTLTLASAVRVASPSICSTLFFCQSIFTPSESPWLTFARRSPSAFQSSEGFCTLIPSSAPPLATWS